jgi:hypothetical protein
LTIAVLPNVVSNLEFNIKDILTLLSCLLGISGFIGLTRLIIIPKIKNYVLTIVLLISGIIGSAIFMSVTGGQSALQWIFTFEEPDEWFIFVWPNAVALIFTIILSWKYWTRKNSMEN